jgi:predicted phosphohydrolase/energy-coupling factor transporter ATP-binding protein EcfA2
MATDNPVYRWLHLSDLHVGCKDEALWWQMIDDFQRSLDAWLSTVGGPPDMVLLTGDLTWSGGVKEYDRLDEFIERLMTALEKLAGARPLIVPVAGNHDVQRPTGARVSAYRVLDAFETSPTDEDVAALRAQFQQKRTPALLARLFTHYERWLERTVLRPLRSKPGVEVHRSFFPGDLTVVLDLPHRFPLAIVGLNSAWSHYKTGDFSGRLLLPAEQFQAALPAPMVTGSPLDIFQRVERALLLMHHPRKWLTPTSRDAFDSHIYPGHRFTACLYGHMHEAEAVNVTQAGGTARCYYQAPSLFGLEKFGTRNESRIFGYTFGQIARDGEVRLWPLRSTRRGDGTWTFDRDTYFHWSREDRAGLLLRPGDPTPILGGIPSHHRSTPPALVLATYCEAVRDETKFIRLDGIAAAAKALNYPIERLYTRLCTDSRTGLVDLADLLPDNRHLLIEGQPGSGKTTFLRLAASILARDALGETCPDGPTWRAVHLGRELARTFPVFLKLSSLATLDDRKGDARLLHYLATETAPRTGDTPESARARREAWDEHLRDGEATLLLDGFDEVGDPMLREQVFDSLREILRAWPKCPVVVTSRPNAVERIKALGFAHASVAPFGADEIHAFVERWVHALFETDPDKASGATERTYANGLVEALRARQELRRLASAPVMLTCLCVVYSHGGGLPEGRAELYRDTIRWLLAARKKQREQAGYHFEPRHPLALLAASLMSADGGKRREIDIGRAAELLTPLLERFFPTNDPPTLHEMIIGWLDFECHYSGVVEASGRGQLQFKHLTFQEYLAAARLAATPNRGWWSLLVDHLEDLQWRETIDLFPGCLLDEQRGGIEDADFLVQQVHALWRGRPQLLRAATITAITGRFLPAFRCAKYELPKDLAQSDAALRVEAEAIFSIASGKEIPDTVRVAAAEAIGVAGDRRLAPERFEANLLWVPDTLIRLGKYPVTVEEFARFVEDGGYRKEKFWMDEDGWSIRTREGWETPGTWDKQLRMPNRPVVWVSCFEAMAYCCWLSAEHPHLHLRLPTEAEWMAAASPDGRRYPWKDGKEPNTERANFGKRVDAPTPVGIYPAGDGEFGHSDLAGNVWEWSLDVARDAKPIEEQVLDVGYPRLVCGGSYWNGAEHVAAAVHYRVKSDRRDDYRGFRVAAVPVSPK